MERPPADPAKLLVTWGEWETGETPPGRVVSNLKTGGLRDVLDHVGTDAGAAPQGVQPAEALEAWMEWEGGQTPPAPVMERLHAAGVRALLEELAGATGDG
ncbi:MAG TPA: hypothetical protein VFU19_15910 [Iamia sp.]|nr:hypothetical protein [Iamia sp.]